MAVSEHAVLGGHTPRRFLMLIVLCLLPLQSVSALMFWYNPSSSLMISPSQTKGGMMNLLPELFRYHRWATMQLIDYCLNHSPALLHEVVLGTDRSILHTLTHIVGTEQWYLELLSGEPAAAPIQRGEVLELSDLRQRFQSHAARWEALFERLGQLDITLPATEWRPAIAQAQDLLMMQAIQHGIDHRSQICTTLGVLGLEAPIIDGWFYWMATHQAED